jgi:predicted nucleic acid-binding protein
VRRLSDLVVSALARVEVPTAIWRKHRAGELSSEDAGVLVDEFEADWFGADDADIHFAVVRVSGEILDLAALSAARHPLRAYDAVQLASALAARAASPEVSQFVCFDQALAQAARAEGFTVGPS